MGMFDTLNFKCPNCGENVKSQSKYGPCMMEDYNINNVPLKILADLQERPEELWCEYCNTDLVMEIQYLVRIDKK